MRATPSPQGAPWLKNGQSIEAPVAETKLEIQKTGTDGGKQAEAAAIEHEIECPRCHDSMVLCSEFDGLYYFCESCDFCLYTIK